MGSKPGLRELWLRDFGLGGFFLGEGRGLNWINILFGLTRDLRLRPNFCLS